MGESASVGICVDGVGLGEFVAVVVALDVMTVVAAGVIVSVPIVGVTEAVSGAGETLTGEEMLVVVAVRLGVRVGSGVGSFVSVAVGVDVAVIN